MAHRSPPDQYSAVAVSLHWLTAILILVLLVSGFWGARTHDVELKLVLLRIHLPAAILVLALTVFRVVWWFGYDRKPAAINGASFVQEILASSVHVLLYVVVFGMAASGIGMMILSSAAPIIFSPDASSLPNFWHYLPRIPHAFGARLLVALLALHVAAALYHHFIRRDDVFRRIWFTQKRG